MPGTVFLLVLIGEWGNEPWDSLKGNPIGEGLGVIPTHSLHLSHQHVFPSVFRICSADSPSFKGLRWWHTHATAWSLSTAALVIQKQT